MLSESLISLDRIALMERIGLLARVGSTKIRTVRECALSERYASPTQIVIPASCPPRNSPFDKGSRNRRGSPPLRSSLDPQPSAVGAKSLSRSLGGYDSPACVQLTPKALFHLAFSRSDRHDRPSASCRLITGYSVRVARKDVFAGDDARLTVERDQHKAIVPESSKPVLEVRTNRAAAGLYVSPSCTASSDCRYSLIAPYGSNSLRSAL